MFEAVKNPSQTARRVWSEHQETPIDDRLRAAFNEILHEPVPLKLIDLVHRDTRGPANSEQRAASSQIKLSPRPPLDCGRSGMHKHPHVAAPRHV